MAGLELCDVDASEPPNHSAVLGQSAVGIAASMKLTQQYFTAYLQEKKNELLSCSMCISYRKGSPATLEFTVTYGLCIL
jgi:hypothetical protein